MAKVLVKLDAVHDGLSDIRDALKAHIDSDSKELSRILGSIWVQFLIIAGALVMIYVDIAPWQHP